jgi:hypothetical protein
MKSHSETLPIAAASNWKQRYLTASFLGACAVAMIGWLIALGWAAYSLAIRLFF